MDAIQRLLAAYTGQLLHGCGDSTCDEMLCATGRRNRSGRAQRDYTPRSARSLALALASGPNPRARLCPRYFSGTVSEDVTKSETSRDPSAFSQLLSSTLPVRAACHNPTHHDGPGDEPTPSARALTDAAVEAETTRWHTALSNLEALLASEDVDPLDEQQFPILVKCLLWLVSRLPSDQEHLAHWRYVNHLVSSALALPSDSLDSTKRKVAQAEIATHLLPVVDGVDHEPTFRLLCHALVIVGPTSLAFKLKLARQLLRGDDLAAMRVRTLIWMVWLKMAFLHHWHGGPILLGQPVVRKGDVASSALSLLEAIHLIVAWDKDPAAMEHDFAIPALTSRADAIVLVQRALNVHPTDRHILHYNAPFSAADKAAYFRTVNHHRMRKAYSESSVNSDLRFKTNITTQLETEPRLKYLEEHYLLINVSRFNVLEDAFDQLWQRRRGELLRPLRVRLGEMEEHEVGHDLGGVQIEFFNLICKELFDEHLQMFTMDSQTGYTYFRSGSLQPLYKYELCGLLFGLAMYNGITIPVSFPDFFYDYLKRGKTKKDPQTLARAWPAIAKSLRDVLRGEGAGLDFAFPLEANGLRLSVCSPIPSRAGFPGKECILHVCDAAPISQGAEKTLNPIDVENISWPGWKMIKKPSEVAQIDENNQKAFVEGYCEWLVEGSVLPQLSAFKRGFFTVIDRDSLDILSPTHFRDILEGSNSLDIDDLRHVTTYENFRPDSSYIQSFWRLVSSWPEEKQKQLVKFVTAAERIPAGGASNLRFKIERESHTNLDRLPTSATCFGTLRLPKYPSVEILDKKLSLALKLGLEGFGTG